MSNPQVRRFADGSFQTNTFLVDNGKRAFVVDCPQGIREVLEVLEKEKLVPDFLYLTHAHCDHIEGLPLWKEHYPQVPVMIHEAESAFFMDPALNLSAFLDQAITVPEADRLLKDNQTILWDETSFQVKHTPGHSPGSTCLYQPDLGVLFAGDLLFRGSVGRSDFPTSNPSDLSKSLKEIIKLPGETAVHCGHGGSTTLERELRTNPYLLEL